MNDGTQAIPSVYSERRESDFIIGIVSWIYQKGEKERNSLMAWCSMKQLTTTIASVECDRKVIRIVVDARQSVIISFSSYSSSSLFPSPFFIFFTLFFSQVRTGLSFVVDWIKLITMCLFLYPQTNPKYHPNHLLAIGPSSNFLPMLKITRQLWMWPVAEVPKLLREHRWILLPVFSRKPNAPLSNRRWIGATVTS